MFVFKRSSKNGQQINHTRHMMHLAPSLVELFNIYEEAGGPRDRAQTKARRKVRERLGRLDPTSASCVWNVCCMAEGAERWAARIGKPAQLGLVVLKEALDGMAGKGER